MNQPESFSKVLTTATTSPVPSSRHSPDFRKECCIDTLDNTIHKRLGQALNEPEIRGKILVSRRMNEALRQSVLESFWLGLQ